MRFVIHEYCYFIAYPMFPHKALARSISASIKYYIAT